MDDQLTLTRGKRRTGQARGLQRIEWIPIGSQVPSGIVATPPHLSRSAAEINPGMTPATFGTVGASAAPGPPVRCPCRTQALGRRAPTNISQTARRHHTGRPVLSRAILSAGHQLRRLGKSERLAPAGRIPDQSRSFYRADVAIQQPESTPSDPRGRLGGLPDRIR